MIVCLAVPAFSASVLRQARDAIKKNQKLDETAKTLIAEATKEGTKHADRVECWRLAAECSRKLQAEENKKMYLKQKADTARFFTLILDNYSRTLTADSLSRLPDEKGRIKALSPRRVHDVLAPQRNNLLTGGKWFYRQGKNVEAFRCFDTYVNCLDIEAFAPDSLATKDTLLAEAAYLAVATAYASNNGEGVLRHSELAQKAGQKSYLIQEYTCRTLAARGDTAATLRALKLGMERYPDHPYFFSNLVDADIAAGAMSEALELVDSMLAKDNTNALRWYARSLVLLRLGRDREAIDACDSCLHYQADHIDALYNKGIASLNLAVIYAETACTDINDPRCLRDREIIRSLYNLAKVPMERVRQLTPEDTTRWAAPLYRIYLNLNMGPQFDEIDKMMKN